MNVRELINKLEEYGDDMLVGCTDSKTGNFRVVDGVDDTYEEVDGQTGVPVVLLDLRWEEGR